MELLYRLKLIKFTKAKLSRKAQLGDLEYLPLALELGSYDIRVLAAKELEILANPIAIPFLRKNLKDPVKIVFTASAQALTAITQSNEIKQEIDAISEHWKKKEERSKFNNPTRNIEMPT